MNQITQYLRHFVSLRTHPLDLGAELADLLHFSDAHALLAVSVLPQPIPLGGHGSQCTLRIVRIVRIGRGNVGAGTLG